MSVYTPPYNNAILNCLDELSITKQLNGDILKSRIYKKAYESILSINYPIYSIDKLSEIKGIGKSILSKINEYIVTGENKEVSSYKTSPNYLFTKIHGVGPKKANELIKKGILSIKELREQVKTDTSILNNVQQLGLKYYEHINTRIPRKEIDIYSDYISSALENYYIKYKNQYRYNIVGSYRRGMETSGDIDIILTNTKASDKPINMNQFVEILEDIFEDVEELSLGSKKSMLICKLDSSKYYRRVDILYSPPNEFPFAILYFTGSAIFNTLMRKHALTLGYTLNEHGIYKMDKSVKGDLIDIDAKKEQDIFQFLDLEYKAPEERKGSLSIVYIEKNALMRYKEQGISYLEKHTQEELEKLYMDANDNYYNAKDKTEIILNDEMFDILREYLVTNYPLSIVVSEVGYKVPDDIKKKVELPYYMGSMNKIKPDTNALDKWKNKYKGPYMISAKLDGVSGMIVYNKGTIKLYTRGNGLVGQDISHLLSYFIETKKVPLIQNKDIEIVFRGEFIIKKLVFEELFASEYANPRNFVSGIINSKKVDISKIQHIEFIPYELVKPYIKPVQQFMHIVKIWDKYVKHSEFSYDSLTNETLSSILKDWRETYEYEIDGIIVTNNELYERKQGNPEHSIAFKMVLTEQVVEAKVLDVEWNPSKDGYLKPRVRIEPVNIGGALIEYATGFNGSFIKNNGIGFGAIVELVRSGDVIPHIMSVIKSVEPKMPSQEYIWSSTNVDIMLPKEIAEKNDVVKEKQIVLFLEKLGVIGFGPGNVRRVLNAGYDDIFKILNMKVEDFLTIDGFKEKLSNKLYQSIKTSLDSKSVIEIIIAFGIFGRGIGEKKIEKVLIKYPNYFKDLLEQYKSGTIDYKMELRRISSVDSFASKTAKQFVDNIEKCMKLILYMNLESRMNTSFKEEPIIKESKITNKTIVMSGFRSKQLEEKIKINGGKVGNTITKKTDILIVKDKTEITTKIEKAIKYGIIIMELDEFISQLSD